MTTIFSKNLRYLRQKRRWTQEDLASKTRRSQPTIQLWETDKRSPTMGMVKELAEMFQVDVNTLIYEDIETGMRSKSGYAESIMPQEESFDHIHSLVDAMRIVLEHPNIAAYGGYDADRLSDTEKDEFANWVANSIQFYARKLHK